MTKGHPERRRRSRCPTRQPSHEHQCGNRPKSGPSLCTQAQRLTVSLRTMAQWPRRREVASAINHLSVSIKARATGA